MPLEGSELENILLRRATEDDALTFRQVFELASEGMAPWGWERAAAPGEDPLDVGLARMRKKISEAAPGTAIVAEVDGQPAGGVITYDIGTEPEEIAPDTPPVFVPLIELENLAPETHYVNVLAVFPGFQGLGVGRRLLRAAAANAGKKGMSIIVEEKNSAALGLYRSEWYEARAMRPVVEGDGWSCPGDNWILMIRPPD